jgi:hypothetical protein
MSGTSVYAGQLSGLSHGNRNQYQKQKCKCQKKSDINVHDKNAMSTVGFYNSLHWEFTNISFSFEYIV